MRTAWFEGLNGGGPFDGWRLKISRFDGWRLNFWSFDGWRLIFRNDVYNTNLNPNLTVSFNKTICFFSYLNTGFNPIICALKMRLLVFNYDNYVYYKRTYITSCKVFLHFNSVEKNTTSNPIVLNYNSTKWRLFYSRKRGSHNYQARQMMSIHHISLVTKWIE